MESRYTVRLVVDKNYDTMLDMTIGCENAQQLHKAKDLINDRLLDHIAMFAMEQALTHKPTAPSTEPDEETPTNDKTLPTLPFPDPDEAEEAEATEAEQQVEAQTEDPAPDQQTQTKTQSKPKPKAKWEGRKLKGLFVLKCKSCGEKFGAFVRTPQTSWKCRCGESIELDTTGKFDITCPDCGVRGFGRTNIEDATMINTCKCGKQVEADWDGKRRMYYRG